MQQFGGQYGRIAGHGAVAGVFMFCLQRFAYGATLDTSVIWGLAFAAAAGVLAWSQAKRGG